MSTEKRWLVFLILVLPTFWATQLVMSQLGLLPPARKAPAAPAKGQAQANNAPPAAVPQKKQQNQANAGAMEAAKKEEGEKKAAPKAELVKLVDPSKLSLGSAERDPKKKNPYNLKVFIDQKGGGIDQVLSSRFDDEFVDGHPTGLPLPLIRHNPRVPSSFGVNISSLNGVKPGVDFQLETHLWNVVPDAKGRLVRPIEKGQEIVLRTQVGDPLITVTRTYRLREGQDQVELDVRFEGAGPARKIAYDFYGPHGIPIEGEWYTGVFRDIFAAQVRGNGITIDTQTAYDVVKAERNGTAENYQALPLAFAGVENQHFAVFYGPSKRPTGNADRWDKETVPYVVEENAQDKQKSDVSLMTITREFEVGDNLSTTHSYRIFAGPKTAGALAAMDATELASYRRGWQLPVLGWLGSRIAQYLISPLLGHIYNLTEYVAGLIGGTRGNYGIAIIFLVILVRLAVFPLSRKQAIMAKRMQEMQPHLAELKEKYKDDKEKLTVEMFALQRRHGVSMFGGCLPALIQIPIFIGLWQALNSSVALRHAPFVLWIRDLSAPDMLFKFPFPIPLVGQWLGPYFNVLPLFVAGLMLVHTKLFQPPALTEEAKMQQSMMKYMMVFMAFMFYKVPSGLGIYFITSSSWAICERLLLPKTLGKTVANTVGGEPPTDRPGGNGGGRGPGGGGGRGPDGSGGGGGGRGPNGNGSGGGWMDRLREKMERMLEEAAQDRTVRNDERANDRIEAPSRTRPKVPPGRKR